MPNEHIAAALMAEPWLILPEKGRVIVELMAARFRGERLDPDEIRAIVAARPAHDAELAAGAARSSGSGAAVAVIPIYGVMAPRVGALEESSGAVSTSRISKMIAEATNDPRISSIVLDIDSPGGSVYGTDELAAQVFRARAQKPIVAVANTVAASAAYYVGSQATEFLVSPSGEVGSIGVFAEHWDYSGFLEAAGIRPTMISAGAFKTEFNPYEPLTAEARAFQQSRIDEYYDAFVKAVGRGRGVTPATVRSETFGQGRMFGAKAAVSRGMADGVGTLEDAINRAASGKVAGRKAQDVGAALHAWGAAAHGLHEVALSRGIKPAPRLEGDTWQRFEVEAAGDYWQCGTCETGRVAAPWASQDVVDRLQLDEPLAPTPAVALAERRLKLAQLGA